VNAFSCFIPDPSDRRCLEPHTVEIEIDRELDRTNFLPNPAPSDRRSLEPQRDREGSRCGSETIFYQIQLTLTGGLEPQRYR
jgi:hypothetical protein